MNDIGAWIKGAGISFTYKSNLAPGPGSADSQLPSRVAGAGVDGFFYAVSACLAQDLIQSAFSGLNDTVRKT